MAGVTPTPLSGEGSEPPAPSSVVIEGAVAGGIFVLIIRAIVLIVFLDTVRTLMKWHPNQFDKNHFDSNDKPAKHACQPCDDLNDCLIYQGLISGYRTKTRIYGRFSSNHNNRKLNMTNSA